MSHQPLAAFVSVQDRSADDPRSGHRAGGLLIDSDVVMVPRPPAEVLDPGYLFDVVIVPTAPDQGDGPPPERIRPRKVVVQSVDGGGERSPVAAYILLEAASRHRWRAFTREEAARLNDALDGCGGDYWSALRRFGIVPDGLGAAPPAELLAAAPVPNGDAALAADGAVDRREQVYGSYRELAERKCCPSPRCCKQMLLGG
ncbi:hypothetical protein WEI85_28995 [Actinomycetes bacterium KLBMP 9797]